MPSSRDLAKRFAFSRSIIVAAHEMLVSDGYIVSRQGSGNFIAEGVPHLKEVTSKMLEQKVDRSNLLCAVDMPLEELKPKTIFRRFLNRRATLMNICHYNYTNPRGCLALRQALATYLMQARGLHVDPSQIFITSGTQQSLDMILRSIFPFAAKFLLERPDLS